MSQEQRRAQLETAEGAERQALASAREAAAILKRQEEQLAIQPRGRAPESVPTRRVPVEQLQRKPKGRYDFAGFFAQRKAGPQRAKPRPIRTVVTRTRFRVQKVRASASRGPSGFESSGRISGELAPEKRERLASVREKVRAVQNEKELNALEKLYRRYRARPGNSKNPELRP